MWFFFTKYTIYSALFFFTLFPFLETSMRWMGWFFWNQKKVAMKKETQQNRKKRQHVCSWWSCSHLPICYRLLLAKAKWPTGADDKQLLGALGSVWRAETESQYTLIQIQRKKGRKTYTHTYTHVHIKHESFIWLDCLEQQSLTFFISHIN